MNTFKDWIFTLLKLFQSVKDENLRWQTVNHEQQAKLKQAQVLAEKNLADDLKKKSIRLEHDIALLRTKNSAELAMFKTKCKQDIKDYKQYLAALDQLKLSIQTSYTHLPEALAFTIHHHAKQLLNKLWEAESLEEKMHCEMRLISFMTAVHDDAQEHLQGRESKKLPEKTLDLLQQP
ncbi:MAG: hypothetical protein Q7U57_10360 [Methylovulum sp.]|nr:hypothetical protein [Methylovulum sp.]